MKELPLASQIFSDIIAYMKYAKYLPDKQRRELWPEIVNRNKAMHLKKFPELKEEIEAAYQFIYDKKNLPSMRSMQFAGKPIELNPIRIYNCSFMHMDHPDAFSEAMELLLSGTGIGFSVQKHHVRKLPPVLGVQRPEGRQRKKRYLVGDSIEGWADAIKMLVESYFYNKREIDYDFRDIRSKGSLLLTSGGKAPGPEPLRECLVKIISVFENAIQERGRACHLKPIEVHDIMCYIAEAVLSGGIRRSAMISLFSLDDMEMLESKFGNWWELNPQRALANNSAMVLRSQIDEEVFFDLWKKIQASRSGEPGIFFSNSEEWGTNPCVTGDTKLHVYIDDNYSTMTMQEVVARFEEGQQIQVLSYNTSTQLPEYKEITSALLTRKDAEIVRIRTTHQTALTCTPDHKIFTTNRGYVRVVDIFEDDYFVEKDARNSMPATVEFMKEAQDVYDITVEDNHNFYANDIVVHNCGEVSLRANQFCNLVEINFGTVESQEDLEQRAKAAAFIATLQSSYTDFHYLRDEWKDTTEKEALIGVSLTGVASEHLTEYDLDAAAKIVVKENKRVAKLIGINPSSRSTVLKPSGTASLILGTSSGVHAWYDEYYWRRVRVGKDEAIYKYLSVMYPELIEDDFFKPNTTGVIKVPMKAPEGAVLRSESAIDTLERVKYLYQHWIVPGHKKGINKNNVSCTINVKDDEWDTVGQWMWENRDHYNGIAVLPYDNGSHIQAPFETCTKEEYEEAVKHLYEVDLSGVVEMQDDTSLMGELACSGGNCEIT